MIAHTHRGDPYKELYVGRVYILSKELTLSVFLNRLEDYTDDLVYAEDRTRRFSTYSSWPNVREALRILRMNMMWDDLANC
jgi:hypothetical protein